MKPSSVTVPRHAVVESEAEGKAEVSGEEEASRGRGLRAAMGSGGKKVREPVTKPLDSGLFLPGRAGSAQGEQERSPGWRQSAGCRAELSPRTLLEWNSSVWRGCRGASRAERRELK